MTPEARAKKVLDKFHRDCLCDHEDALVAGAHSRRRGGGSTDRR